MKKQVTHLSLLMATIFCCIAAFSQQGIGYYPNMDGGLGKQSTGSLGTVKDTIKWSYTSVTGGGQVRLISSTGGYGGPKYVTVGKSTAATAGSSTSVSTNQVYKNTFLANTLYVVQFHYKANPASALTPDTASFVFITVDGTSGNRKTKKIQLGTPTTWTKFYDTVRTDNVTVPNNLGVAGINIKTSAIGTATLVDVDNYVIYPADNQTTGGADITAPNPVTAAVAVANSPADINVNWNTPLGGIDSGGYVVIRYTVNPSLGDGPLGNAIYAVGDSVNGTNKGTVVYTGKATAFLDNYNIAGGTTYYYQIYAVDKAFNYSAAADASAATQAFTNYYYNGTSSLTNVSSWGTNTNGTGTAPTDFTSAGHFFIIKNTSTATVDAPWVVSGSASKVILGDGISAITLNIPAGNSLTGKLDIIAPATGKNAIILNGGIFPTLGTVTGITDLTVGTNVNATIPKAQWGSVVIASPSSVVVNIADTLFAQNFIVNTGSVFSTTTNGTSNNTIAPVTIDFNGFVNINGVFKTGKTAGFVASLNFLSGTPNYSLGPNSTIVCDKVSSSTTQIISAIQYVNLEVGGTSPKAFEAGNLKVSGNLLITTTGTISTAPTSLELNGTNTQVFDGLGATSFSDVTFSGGGLKKLRSNVSIGGGASFNAGRVDVDVDTLTFNSSATIGSGSPASYIITGNNAVGKAMIKGLGATSTVSLPVGSQSSYLPVTLTPSQGSDYAVSVFGGLTKDGSINGILADAATLDESVNAVWDISRPNGAGNTLVEVAWNGGNEGLGFSSLANNQIGLQHYNGTNWVSGSSPICSNSANTASDSFATFTQFAVSKLNGLLPICKIDLQIAKVDNTMKIDWKTSCEINVKEFVVEKSLNGLVFNAINSVAASNTNATQKNYQSIDNNINSNIVYYRIKVIDNNGKIEYSKVVAYKTTTKHSFEVVTNPVLNKELKVQLNNLQRGNYTLEIVSILGQKVQQVNLELDNNNVSKTIQLNQSISSGLYFVKLSGLNIAEINAVLVK